MVHIRSHGPAETGPRSIFFSKRPESGNAQKHAGPTSGQPRLLVCVDDSLGSRAVVAHALAVARSLNLALTLARVVEAGRHSGSPTDPIQWQIRYNEYRDQLIRIAGENDVSGEIESVVLTGSAADELTGWAEDNGATLLALATRANRLGLAGLGATAQRILDHGATSLLLIPPSEHVGSPIHYRRLLVPIDGSYRAESVLPIAARIARRHGAELILAHIVPQPEIASLNHPVPEIQELCDRLANHSERNARSYLEELRGQFLGDGLSVRTLVATDGDPRTQLRRLAAEQQVDLMILSSHGYSGLEDVACGSVTEYLATHAPAPLLILRPNFAHGFGVGASDPEAEASHSLK